MLHLPEDCKIVQAIPPSTNAAGVAGDYVCLKNCQTLFVVCHSTEAVGIVPWSFNEATNVAGAGAALFNVPQHIWANEDCAATDLLVQQADAATYTSANAAGQKMVVFQIDPGALNVAGGFDCIQLNAGASDATDYIGALYYLVERYHENQPPSAIID